MNDSTTQGPAELDGAARDAAIAAMGYRLAAAGPRTRQRITPRTRQPTAQPPTTAAPPATLIANRAYAFDRKPHRQWRKPLATLRRLALLATAATCSFSVVLLAQNPRWAAGVRTLIATQTPPEQTELFPPVATHPTAPQTVADLTLAPIAPLALEPAEPPAPENQLPHLADAAPEPAAEQAPAPPTNAPETTPHARAGEAKRPMHRLTPPPPVIVASTTPLRLAEAKPHQHATIAQYELPRWLTRDPPSRKRAVIMSEPPHDLTLPPGTITTAAAPSPTNTARPPAAPKVVFASATAPVSVPLRPPLYRRPYLGPYYPYPYPGYYPYGGYAYPRLPYYPPYRPPPRGDDDEP